MQIQCTFNDYEELESFVVNYAGRMIARSIVEGNAKEQLDKQAAQKPAEAVKEEKPKKDTPKVTEAKDAAPVNAPKGVETEVPAEFKKEEAPKAEKIDESSTKVPHDRAQILQGEQDRRDLRDPRQDGPRHVPRKRTAVRIPSGGGRELDDRQEEI